MNLLKPTLLLFTFFGANQELLPSAPHRPVHLVSREAAPVAASDSFEIPSDCRAHIAAIVCLVEPDWQSLALGELPDNSVARPCLPGSSSYAEPFEAIYDKVPPLLQRMFCSLKKIYIEKELFASAYADTDYRFNDELEMQTDGAYLGVKLATLGTTLSYAQWSTWKEQLSFGGNQRPSLVSSPQLPQVHSKNPQPFNALLYAHVVHEFAHLFDTANDINAYESCEQEDGSRVCTFQKDSWATFSWIDSKRVRPEQNFKNRKKLCFYKCETGTIDPSAAPRLYEDLDRSNFIDAYAATHFREDFADTFEIYMITQHLGSSVSLVSGRSYDLGERLLSERLRPKLAFIENFLASPHIKYP